MSWFLAFLGFAVLIVLHEAGHFAAAKAVGMRVERFMLFFGKPLVSFRRGETEYGIGPIPLGGYVKITGMSPREELSGELLERAYYRQAPWKRIFVILAGPAVNIVLAFVVLWLLFGSSGAPSPPEPTRTVAQVEQGFPAERILRPGDTIVSVDGVTDRRRFTEQIASRRCAPPPTDGCRAQRPVVLRVERGGEIRTVRATPVYDGQQERTRLGFAFDVRRPAREPLGVVDGATRSVDAMWQIVTGTVSTLGRIFVDEQARRDVSGVVGSYETTRQAVQIDLYTALFILAFISLSLGVINLFPFLPLDGGHVFWAVAEKVRGRAIPFHYLERAGVVGFVLIAALFFLGLSNDIGRLRGEGFDLDGSR